MFVEYIQHAIERYGHELDSFKIKTMFPVCKQHILKTFKTSSNDKHCVSVKYTKSL